MKGLAIGGIDANTSSWKNENTQIDLLIDRSDRTINICELKFSENQFTISKSYANNIRKKKNEFKTKLNHRKNIIVTFVTTFGVKENKHSLDVMDNQVTMDSLFEKET